MQQSVSSQQKRCSVLAARAFRVLTVALCLALLASASSGCADDKVPPPTVEPDADDELDTPPDTEPDLEPFERFPAVAPPPFVCEARQVAIIGDEASGWELDLDIDPDASGWMLTAFAVEGSLLADQLATGAWTRSFDDYGASVLAQQRQSPAVLTLQVPHGDLDADWLVAGEQTLRLRSEEPLIPCWRLFTLSEQEGEGQLGVRIFVYSQSDALPDEYVALPDERGVLRLPEALSEAYAETARIFGAADITLDVVQVVWGNEESQQDYAILESYAQLRQMVAEAPLPSSTVELQSIDIFVVDALTGDFATSGQLGGLSSGLPGPPSLHGTMASGVVVTTRALGDERGNRQLGRLLAHELGHFLGLYHTTELDGVGEDPISDTPFCGSGVIGNPAACADAENLMFPTNIVRSPGALSEEQQRLLRLHPLLRWAGTGEAAGHPR